MITNLKDVQALFDTNKRHHQLWITGADYGCKFEIPILRDFYGLTPLDMCFENGKELQQEEKIGFHGKKY